MDQNNDNHGPDISGARVKLEPKRLSFSQAQGYESIPAPLKLEELPCEARNQIWNSIYSYLEESKKYVVIGPGKPIISGSWRNILVRMHSVLDNLAQDDWDSDFDSNRRKLREHIEQDHFNKVFDRLQFIMREHECPCELIGDLQETFERCKLAYIIDKAPPATIFPAATPEEGAALAQALQVIREAGLSGSSAHLRKASSKINSADAAGAIRESIHAFESVARQIEP